MCYVTSLTQFYAVNISIMLLLEISQGLVEGPQSITWRMRIVTQKLLILVGCSALIFACSSSPVGGSGAKKSDAQGSQNASTTGLDWTGNSSGSGTATAGTATAGNATAGNATGDGTGTGGATGTATGTGTGASTGTGTGTEPPPGKLCTPKMFKCNGTVLTQCNLDGTAWNDIAGCKSGTVCDPVQGKCVCQAQCTGKSCGDDGCGGSCGNCAPGQQCNNGQCSDNTVGQANCVAAGTGNKVGSKAKDITWTTSENKKLTLHSFCGSKKAVLAVEAAAW